MLVAGDDGLLYTVGIAPEAIEQYEEKESALNLPVFWGVQAISINIVETKYPTFGRFFSDIGLSRRSKWPKIAIGSYLASTINKWEACTPQ